MTADIAQIDAIIDKFMDYARPDQIRLTPVSLSAVAGHQLQVLHDRTELRAVVDIPADLQVLADERPTHRAFSPACWRTPCATAAMPSPAWPRSSCARPWGQMGARWWRCVTRAWRAAGPAS